ncbi:MAG: hypothetical protein J6Y80_07325, partial [Victivallales bacterium]|nr:hypothetical protein [Victivallales bacterium]
ETLAAVETPPVLETLAAVETPAAMETPAAAETPVIQQDVVSGAQVEAASPAPPPAPQPTLKQRIGDLARERDQLNKKIRVQKEAHARELAAKELELKKLQKKLSECAETFNDAVAEVREACDQEARRQIADFEAATLGIHPDCLAYASQAHHDREQLRERLNQLVTRQREINTRFRTRQQLRDELQKIDQYITQVQRMVEDAIQPIPELTDLQKDLETKAEELNAQLHNDTEGLELRNNVKVLPNRLAASIIEIPSTTDGLATCSEVAQFLDSRLGRKLFTQEELQNAAEMLDRRRQAILAALDKERQFAELTPTEEHPLTPPIHHQLASLLDQFKDVDLFVDGCNVILNDSYWADIINTPNGFSQAKTDFIARCRKKARFFHSLTLVFDSDLTTMNTEREGNFAVLYPGKVAEDQNADNYIVEEFEKRAAAEEETGEKSVRWLVTNDHGLQNRVVNSCDAIIANTGFAIFVRQ